MNALEWVTLRLVQTLCSGSFVSSVPRSQSPTLLRAQLPFPWVNQIYKKHHSTMEVGLSELLISLLISLLTGYLYGRTQGTVDAMCRFELCVCVSVYVCGFLWGGTMVVVAHLQSLSHTVTTYLPHCDLYDSLVYFSLSLLPSFPSFPPSFLPSPPQQAHLLRPRLMAAQ
jgi:hypothetical protein